MVVQVGQVVDYFVLVVLVGEVVQFVGFGGLVVVVLVDCIEVVVGSVQCGGEMFVVIGVFGYVVGQYYCVDGCCVWLVVGVQWGFVVGGELVGSGGYVCFLCWVDVFWCILVVCVVLFWKSVIFGYGLFWNGGW